MDRSDRDFTAGTSGGVPVGTASGVGQGGAPEMREKRFYVNGDGVVTIVCPNCGKIKPLNLNRLPANLKSLKVQCNCGEVFKARIEYRKKYRKPVELPGSYLDRKRDEADKLLVLDISMGGMKLRTLRRHGMCAGDVIEVTFTLNTVPPRTITREVRIMHVTDLILGCAFTSSMDRDPDIGLFLMA